MIFLVLVVLGGNQVIIGLFSRFSDKLILENHELNALQEMRGALDNIMITNNHYPVNYEDLRACVVNADNKFKQCKEVLSPVHQKKAWENIALLFGSVQENVRLLINAQPENGYLQHKITSQTADLIPVVESLINETVQEIGEYEDMNRKVKVHGTITVVVFGTLLILLLAIGSYRFIRGFTRPIEQLVDATKKIREGDRNLQVRIDSKDEFMQLADSFNAMLDALNKTSLSEKYLNNILNNLYGALLVTDAGARIRSINTATTRMLKYDKAGLSDKEIWILFKEETKPERPEKNEEMDLNKLAKRIAKKTVMLDRDGHEIPVYMTAMVLKNSNGEPEGMVVVGHDLTEEKENEAKLEKLRKERMIAIHETQELERLRIARDLHDGLGQLLTGISYSIEKIQQEHDIDTAFAERLQKQVNSAIQETKSIAQNLTPSVLKDFGLVEAIENLVQRINLLHRTQFIFNSYAFTERIDAKLEKAIFRICQEAVNNIIKHSGATEATIELYRVEDMIVLVVEDNGNGFDIGIIHHKEETEGLGLISMSERVNAFDGDFSINSNPGTGTEIVIEIPCRKGKNHGDN